MNLICYIFVCFLKVAIIAGNFELAEFIKNHKDTDIGKLDKLNFFDVCKNNLIT